MRKGTLVAAMAVLAVACSACSGSSPSSAVGEPGATGPGGTASGAVPANRDYWYCGPPALKPLQAEDDGMHTRLRFDSRNELPALFVLGDDGGESLLNFNVEHGDVVVHRVARRFVLRRGKLVGCIVNHGYMKGEQPAASGTVAPTVERTTRRAGP